MNRQETPRDPAPEPLPEPSATVPDLLRDAYRQEWVKAQVEIDKKPRLDEIAHRDRVLATDDHLERKLHEAIWAEASAGVTRVHDAAKWIETASAALAGLYATALAITFSIASNPLPVRGFISPLFFAVGTAAFYLAYLGSGKGPDRPVYDEKAPERNWEKSQYVADYAVATAHVRGVWLRAAVLALLFGVAFMPAPYIDFGRIATARPAPAPVELAPLPAPPAGNPDAETLWYQKTLERFEKQQTQAAPDYVMTLPAVGQVSFDVGLGGLALLAWLVASLVAARLLRRTSSTSGPVLVRHQPT